MQLSFGSLVKHFKVSGSSKSRCHYTSSMSAITQRKHMDQMLEQALFTHLTQPQDSKHWTTGPSRLQSARVGSTVRFCLCRSLQRALLELFDHALSHLPSPPQDSGHHFVAHLQTCPYSVRRLRKKSKSIQIKSGKRGMCSIMCRRSFKPRLSVTFGDLTRIFKI